MQPPRHPQFQSHAGSIEARMPDRLRMRRLRFQSHAGSIEAAMENEGEEARLAVSIPRWFD